MGSHVSWPAASPGQTSTYLHSGRLHPVVWSVVSRQLSHSLDWFAEKYDHTCSPTPILIHHTAELHQKASARPGTRVITFAKLAKLREAVTCYAAALAADNDYRDPDKVSEQLATWQLNGKKIAQHWAVVTRKP
jgi:hypothetical protein